MSNSSRVFIKNRTNRRVRNMSYSGLNKRKGIGRRKHEKFTYYSYLAVFSLLAISVITLIVFSCINFI